jgi:hypothetical protein
MSILNYCSHISLLQLMYCFKSVRRWFQLFCRTMSNCHGQTLPVSRSFVTSRCFVVLLGTSLSGYALLNASRLVTNSFDAKLCSRMNTRSAREYTMFAPAQLLRNWSEQWPSNQYDLDSSFTGCWERVFHGGGLASDLIFVL